MDLPKIVVGGYPNSGTSFLTNLVCSLGFSPGSSEKLRRGDSHNRWGYFEHTGLESLVRNAALWERFSPEVPGFLPSEPFPFNTPAYDSWRTAISNTATEDSVEVYKDNALPIVYKLFSEKSRFIIIRRSIEDVYSSSDVAGYTGYEKALCDVTDSWTAYYRLAQKITSEVNCLIVEYEDFKDDFEQTAKRVCRHLAVEWNAEVYESCRRVFRPRVVRSRYVGVIQKTLFRIKDKCLHSLRKGA